MTHCTPAIKRRALLPIHLPFALLLGITTAATAQDFGDFKSWTLTSKAWQALERQQYEEGLTFIAKTKELYEAEAVRQQAGLSDFLPADKAQEAWALNDVGTCYFIEAQIRERQRDAAAAAAAYKKLASSYRFAQCWDPKGWFWRPAEAAAEKVKQMDFDSLLDK